MQRRDFFKISAVTGATAALDACGHPEHQLIRFVPEEDLVPGVATWKPSICTLCPAGCGLMVRVIEGEAEVVRNGQVGLIKMGLAKKLEGNPNHPISQGKLCPRGQAGLQVTYHPDRIKNPLKRSGPRGSGQFQEISWDEGIKELVAELAALRSRNETNQLACLTKPLHGQRRDLIERFSSAFGASPPVYFELYDEAVLRRANAWSFGRPQLPTIDLANAAYVVSFGADFLGTWNSPVAQGVGYGQMRQGRPGRRAKLVQIESRMSQTGANADEWISIRPGSEGALALSLAHVIINSNLRPASAAGHAGTLIGGWTQGLPDFAPQTVEKVSGVSAATITRLGREIAQHTPAVAVIGGAPLAQTNGLWGALAVNALNVLLCGADSPGGLFFTREPPISRSVNSAYGPSTKGGLGSLLRITQPLLHGQTDAAKVLLLYEANPVFALPPIYQVRTALERLPFIASFGSFVDETSCLADIILPDHSPLESWLDDIVEAGTARSVVSLAPPAMRPLHNTRAMPDVLLEVARLLGRSLASALPWKSFEDVLHENYSSLSQQKGSIDARNANQFWNKMQEQGGWWSAELKTPPLQETIGARHNPLGFQEPEFDGPAQEFPFNFLPFASPLLYDGSLAHLPWLQETPDPVSTAMWGAWVEINPKTAERLGIQQGDLVEVASRHGKLQAPALIYPGIAPDVVAMPVGQGHENYTRYATGRGANPISILAPMVVAETGSLAWAATRVKISRVGEGRLILFGAELREKPEERR